MIRYKVIKKIKALRQANDWSIAELSNKMGFNSQMGYANIENGKTKINLDQLEKIAEIFDTTIEELIGIKNESYEIKELKNENEHLKLRLNDTVRLIKFHEKNRQSLAESTIKVILRTKGLDAKVISEGVDHLLTIHNNYFIEIAKLVSPEAFQTKVIKVKEDVKYLKSEIFNHKKFKDLDKYDQDLTLQFIENRFSLNTILLPIKFPIISIGNYDWKKTLKKDFDLPDDELFAPSRYNEYFKIKFDLLNQSLSFYDYPNFDYKKFMPFMNLLLV